MNQPQDRIEYLRELLKEDPQEPFIHYAICLELKKREEGALPAFHQLLDTFPEYLPAYYQTALMLAENGKIQEAAEVAGKGISLAEKLDDRHALAELKGLRQDILAGEYD
jgi:tetratricopeptide (TPR) repeat protein